MKTGDIVQIQDDNEWKDLYGIVDCIVCGVIHIFCVQEPCYLYKATNKNNIKVIQDESPQNLKDSGKLTLGYIEVKSIKQ